jgi:hypothetical protein
MNSCINKNENDKNGKLYFYKDHKFDIKILFLVRFVNWCWIGFFAGYEDGEILNGFKKKSF